MFLLIFQDLVALGNDTEEISASRIVFLPTDDGSMLRAFAIFIAFIVSSASRGDMTQPFIVQPIMDGIYLSPYLDICPDTQPDRPLADRLQHWDGKGCERRKEDIAQLTIGAGRYWFRLPVENRQGTAIASIMEHNYPSDYLRIIQVGADGVILSDEEFGNRIYRKPSILHRYAAQKLMIVPGVQTFYINLDHAGSVRLPLRFWTEEAFQHNKYLEDLGTGLLMGVTLAMMFYNIFLFMTFRFKQQIFYVGFLIATFWYLMFWSGLSLLLPSPWREIFTRTWSGSASMMCVFLCHFTLQFLGFRGKSKGFTLTFRLFAWGFGIATVLELVNRAYAFITFSLLLSPYMIACFIAGCRGVWMRGRPAIFYLLSFSLMMLGGALENFISIGLVDGRWSFWPFFAASNLQSILLSLAIGDKLHLDQKNAHRKIVELNDDLQKHVLHVNELVDEKTLEIRSIMTNLPQGILMIQKDLTIHRDYSAYSAQLFETEHLDGLPVLDVVFQHTQLGVDRLAQLRAALEVCLGEPEIAFALNEDCFPLECRRNQHILEMNWHPILTPDGRIERFLLSVRDVTSLRSLQNQSDEQIHRLELIGEIIGTEPSTFLRFLRSSRTFQTENSRLIANLDTHDPEVCKILFINLHTMKGIARSLRLTKMADLCHAVEQHLDDLQNERRDYAREPLQQDLDQISLLLDIYESVSRKDLGRTMQVDENALIPMRELEPLVKRIDRLDSSNRREMESFAFDVRKLLMSLYYQVPERVFADIFSSLPRLARDLGKDRPRVHMELGKVLITREAEDLFRNILIHLMRNSMDHGIESAEERREKGKPEQGQIQVFLRLMNDDMELIYSDDGRGLNLKSIRSIAFKKGLWDGQRAIAVTDLAAFIFTSGFTTSQTVSDISGRGVGMDAVSRYIREQGGTIALLLPPEVDATWDFSPFRVRIRLSARFFRNMQDAA